VLEADKLSTLVKRRREHPLAAVRKACAGAVFPSSNRLEKAARAYRN
jgi:hypothetical protein